MSDHIESDGKKYYEESYLALANNTASRRGERIAELEAENERLTRERDEAREWIVAAACRCKPGHVKEQCPTCNAPLHRVRNDSPLNDDQFAAIRAGDYFCKQCTSNQALSGYRYYWERDLPRNFEVTCGRCEFLFRTQPAPVSGEPGIKDR
jgi:hypothetical protein